MYPVKRTSTAYAAFVSLAVIWSFSVSSLWAKSYSGIPQYRFYGEQDFHTSDRALFVAQAPDGTTIFGTEAGLLQFDGTAWKEVFSSRENDLKITSLYFEEETVYSGGYQRIGHLTQDDAENIVFSQLNKEFFSDEPSEYFRAIFTWGESKIVYSGTRSVAIFDRKDGSIAYHTLDTWVKTTFIDDDRLHVGTPIGVFHLNDSNEFDSDPLFDGFAESRTIEASITLPNGDLLLGTANAGIFIKSGNEIRPSVFDDLNHLLQYSLTDIERLPDGRIAVALAGKGVMLYNPDGSVSERLDELIDYRFRSARSLMLDSNNALWIMLNTSLAKVTLDMPMTEIDERLRPSLNYGTLHFVNGELLLRNNNALTRAAFEESGRLLGFVPAITDSDDYVVDSATGPDGLYISGQGRISLYQKGHVTRLYEEDPTHAVDVMIVPSIRPDTLLTITATHVNLLKRQENKLYLLSQTPNPSGYPYRLAEDDDGNIWVENGHRQVTRIWLQNDEIFAKSYGAEAGLNSDWVTIWAHEGSMLFTQGAEVLSYDPATDTIVPNPVLDDYFPKQSRVVHRAATDPQGNIWLSLNEWNSILWKKEDGTYEVDRQSLSPMGKIYFSFAEFPNPKDTFLLTSNQLFHYDHEKRDNLDDMDTFATKIISIQNAGGENIYYQSLGGGELAELELKHKENNLAFRLSNTYSRTHSNPQYRFLLEGLSSEWSQWSDSSEINFTNLDSGIYTLKVETRLGNRAAGPPLGYAFRIKPAFYETPWAFVLYFIAAVALVMGAIKFASRRLKIQNLKLERMVFERTHEIEVKNQELEKQTEMTEAKNDELATALSELQNTQDKLLQTARKAGMAEVATNVLHNVGNVLNSINIGIVNLSSKLSQSRVHRLQKVTDLVNENRSNLSSFLTDDPKGKAIPDYLSRLSKVISAEMEYLVKEVTGVRDNIDHVKRIITAQQAHAKTVDVIQSINIKELVEAAVTMLIANSEKYAYKVTVDLDPELAVESDKHKVLQMLTNFIKNAKEAIRESGVEVGQITIAGRFLSDRQSVSITVEDNGIGIDADHIEKVFSHGFTTKTEGHGFGMHSAANTVKSLGGELHIESQGIGHGAKVILKLPCVTPKGQGLKSRKKALREALV